MSDERITDLILQRLERIEGKLDSMQTSGCAKAEKHERTPLAADAFTTGDIDYGPASQRENRQAQKGA